MLQGGKVIEKIKIGQRFGRLTVIEQGEDYICKSKRIKRWICQCDCGKQTLSYQHHLLAGKTSACKNCASLKYWDNKLQDLTGYHFGKFTVIKQVEKPQHIKNRGRYWLCKCDCGNERIISTKDINRKLYISCGECIQYNTYDLSGEYGIGYTSKGEKFYFDLEDYDLIKEYSWSKTSLGYLIAYIKGSDNDFVYMHRLVLGLTNNNKYDVDHEKHNVYDNRKEMLRICTHQENIMNSKLSKNNTSGITGVRYDSKVNKWIACIMYNYKTIHLGAFDNFDDAVHARKKAEEKYFGEYVYKKGCK